MPFNIPFNYPPAFSSGSNSPLIQGWVFNPPALAASSSLIGVPNVPGNTIPAPQDVVITLRDFLASTFNASHSDFYLQVSLIPDPNAPVMVSLTSSSHNIDTNIILNAATDPALLIKATYGLMSIVDEGTYNAYIDLKVYGSNNVTGLDELLDNQALEIELVKTGTTLNVLTPREVNVAYLKNTGAVNNPSFDVIPTVINGTTAWWLHYYSDVNVVISHLNLPDPFGFPGTVLFGDQPQSGVIGFPDTWDNKTVGLHHTFIEVIFPSSGFLTLGMNINVMVFDAAGVIVDPGNLYFESRKPINAAAQSLDIYATGAFTITAPSWLQLSATSGTGAALIMVNTIDVLNLTEGSYTGDIIVTSGGVDFIVPVVFNVMEGLETNLSTTGLNFTLDANVLRVDNFDNHHYMEISTTGVTYSYDSHAFQFNDVVKIPFFNGTARYVIGKVIHQAQQLMTATQAQLPFLISGFQSSYNYPAYSNVDVMVKVYNRNSGDVVLERSLHNLKFVPGTKPLNTINDKGILSYQNKVSRITTSGVFHFNIFSLGAGSFRISKNGVPFGIYSFNNGTRPFKNFPIKGSDYQPGDRLAVHVDYIDATGAFKSIDEYLFIYPPQEYSRTIAFLTPYNTIELLECTGQLNASSQYNRRSNTVLRNGVSIINHVDTNRDDQLFINTGYIPEQQRSTIDLLNRSDKAWLIDPVDGIIEISITSTDLAHSDSENFLHSFDLEFTVNRQQDAQIHLF